MVVVVVVVMVGVAVVEAGFLAVWVRGVAA